jgi:hypothetical protein
MVYFGSQFQRFQSKQWIHCFGPMTQQNIMVAGEAAGKQRERKEKAGDKLFPLGTHV